MNNTVIKAETALEFNKIKEMLENNAFSKQAKQRLARLEPYMDEAECNRHIEDTTSARSILDAQGSPPLPFMGELEEVLALCAAGAMLLPEQLAAVMQFASSCSRVCRYLAASNDERIAPYGSSIMPLDELVAEIERCIRHNAVDSNATSALYALRRQMETTQLKIKEKLNSLLANNRKWFSDNYVVQRNGRHVLPVKREYKNNVSGSVVEISSTKSTYFIEPNGVRKLTDQLQQLEIEEDAEVRRILYTLTAQVEDNQHGIRRNMEIMEQLDYIFAKARLSQQMSAIPASINTGRRLNIQQGRHPLLDAERCVPLNFHIDNDIQGVIITGPNTGGKTVAIKTVGLLSMMAQSGLHVPAERADICMHSGYYCDIGDSQSISANLSTFSGHMTNIIGILQGIGNESLVLLDELGSGTDPAEGMGIAIAVLDELRSKGCMFLVTTHYPEVKEYAEATDGVISARMAFDRETLSPLYRLELGQLGESCALYIAQRLGLPSHILRRAYDAAYTGQSSSQTRTAPELNLRDDAGTTYQAQPTPAIRKMEQQTVKADTSAFSVGDSVMVLPGGETGIVYKPADDMGRVWVQVKGEKQQVNQKRLKLKQPASELYPEGYDMSIIFDSVENRKASKKLGKRHVPGLQVTYEDY